MTPSNLDLARECGAHIDLGALIINFHYLEKLDAFAERIRAVDPAECKPSLYLFFSEHGGIRYWTREADAAARKAIEFGTEPERFYATPVPAPVQTAAQYLSGSDMADLQQLDADFSDGEGWCLPKARMTRLAELGVIRHGGGGHYSITSFGRLILGEEFSRLPLETVEECNARIGKAYNAIKAQ